ARLEQVMVKIDKQKVDLNAVVQSCVTAKNATQQRIISPASEKPVWVSGDAKYLQILLNNLLQNALHYGRERVDVQLHMHAKHICLIIADDGEGFAEDEKDVLKPFVRGKAAAEKAKGYGIGLAIVQRIIEWHNGELTIG